MILTETELAELQALAQGEMTDTCKITRPGEGRGPFNEETMQYDAPPPITVYEGVCEFDTRTAPLSASTSEVAEQDVLVHQLVLKLPLATSGAVRRNLTGTALITRDAAMAGRPFRIASLGSMKTTATKREFLIEMTG